MVKPIELKKGSIILHKGKSYLIIDDVMFSQRFDEFSVITEPVSCRYCEGNLFKSGTKKGQYLCSDCNKPNWLNSEGEHEEA